MGSEYTRVVDALARNLSQLRAKKGLSQEALALDAGVDRTFVSKIERKLANPSLATVSALAEVLGTTVIALLTKAR